MRSPHVAVAAVFVATAWALPGCGHPATREECKEITDKIIDLELKSQGLTDPQQIATRKAETEKAIGDDLTSKCVGRKIRDAAMTCIRAAKSSDQIDSVCLR